MPEPDNSSVALAVVTWMTSSLWQLLPAWVETCLKPHLLYTLLATNHIACCHEYTSAHCVSTLYDASQFDKRLIIYGTRFSCLCSLGQSCVREKNNISTCGAFWFNTYSEFHRSERKYSLYILRVYSATLLPSSEPHLHLCMCWLNRSIPLIESLITCFPNFFLLNNVFKTSQSVWAWKKDYLLSPCVPFPTWTDILYIVFLISIIQLWSKLSTPCLLHTFTPLSVSLNPLSKSIHSVYTSFFSVSAHLTNEWMWINVTIKTFCTLCSHKCSIIWSVHHKLRTFFCLTPVTFTVTTWLILPCLLASPLPPCAY